MFIKDLVQHWLMTNRRWSCSPVLNVGEASVCCLRSVQICIWWRSQNCRGPFFYYICHFWHWESAGAFLLLTDFVGCFNTGKAQKLLNVSNLKNWSPKHKERMKECQQQQQQQNSTAAPKPYRFIILHSSGSSGMLGWWRSVNQFIHLRRIKCTDSSDSNTILFSNWDSYLGGRVPRRSNSLTLKI